MSILSELGTLTLTVTVFQVQLLLIVVFLAFAVCWVMVVEPYLAERTGPSRNAERGGDPE